jgi:hypothetical protein
VLRTTCSKGAALDFVQLVMGKKQHLGDTKRQQKHKQK